MTRERQRPHNLTTTLFIYCLYIRTLIVVAQDVVVFISTLAHHGGTYLTETHAVSPACAGEHETLRNALGVDVEAVGYECRAVEMALAQYASYLQFLADDERLFRTDDLQSGYSAALAALQRHEINNRSQVHFQVVRDEFRQFRLCVLHLPAVEVGCFLVIIVQHLRQYLIVVGIAERLGTTANPALCLRFVSEIELWEARFRNLLLAVSHSRKITLRRVFPAILELFGLSAAAFAEACVANLIARHQYLASCVLHRQLNVLVGGARYALLTLAMVVGAHIEYGVVVAVVPSY